MGLLATGTSCLALVCVMGRRRVPRPPARMSALMAKPPCRAALVVRANHRIHRQNQAREAHEADEQIAEEHALAPLHEDGLAAIHHTVAVAGAAVAVAVADLQTGYAARVQR